MELVRWERWKGIEVEGRLKGEKESECFALPERPKQVSRPMHSS